MYIFKESAQKLRNIFYFFMTIFYNFPLKIETSWAKMVVKAIFETWNATNYFAFILHFWFIPILMEMFRNTQCKNQ